MNLLARYNMLRTAVVAMAGVPDNVDTLKEMATVLRVSATMDTNAAASLLVLQTLIVTHGTTAQEIPDAWAEALRNQLLDADMVVSKEHARDMMQQIIFGEST
jgi:nucleotide-binding universal stress UspA family protein